MHRSPGVTFKSVLSFGIFSLLIMSSFSPSRAASITVDLDKPAGALSPIMHGIFFEDINFGADGGLYTQRIKNGSFEFTPDPMVGWHKTEDNRAGGIISLQSDQ